MSTEIYLNPGNKFSNHNELGIPAASTKHRDFQKYKAFLAQRGNTPQMYKEMDNAEKAKAAAAEAASRQKYEDKQVAEAMAPSKAQEKEGLAARAAKEPVPTTPAPTRRGGVVDVVRNKLANDMAAGGGDPETVDKVRYGKK